MSNASADFSNRENRIMTYAMLASTFLIGGRAQGEVVVVNPNSTLVNNCLYIDFDGDGTNDIRVCQFSYVAGGTVSMVGNRGLQNNNNAVPYAAGARFDSADNWVTNANFIGDDKYLGIRLSFPDSTGYYYSWVRLQIPSNGASITVVSHAYETIKNLGILAGSETSLPVTLVDFKAIQDNRTVVLNWITESEIENQGFIVERCTSGTKQWQEIASFQTHPELVGQGNSTVRTEYEYIDDQVEFGKSYDYRLSDVSYSTVNRGQPVVISGIVVDAVQPASFSLHPSFPNPFNPATRIGFNLSEESKVQLAVYDLRGQLITTLLNEAIPAGEHQLEWDAADVAAGVYFLELQSGDQRQMQKITLLK